MKYCSHCGNPVTLLIPQGDNRERFVCVDQHCEKIHYQNPCNITGCLPTYQNKVLLCKRAIEPRYGMWTLPAGFMENGETTEQGAIRESWEEANATLSIDKLYALYNLPYINQVYFFYKAELKNTEFSPGEESLEVALFSEEEVPWEELAFSVVKKTLQHYFMDRKTGEFPLHNEDLTNQRHNKR
ncbi:ADP-ribose pyrophosphatase [Candidatus Endobugula sertula]|uniref:ADP-ribose pyrophosphatase n=1 Tax=Candidatus Endobugula sertula TaxID=62101 RepID=A0A1D2QMJ6_9GAMM|nr:ADP-ribose pyrophosphatase [Candidatus Endobugula sertula]